MGRRIAWVLSLVLLLLTGVVGISAGINERSMGVTNLQKSVTAGAFLYGILGLITAFGLFRRRRWTVRSAILWGVAVTYVPAAAIMGYGGEGALWSSAIAASFASALIAAGVVWTARAIARGNDVGTS